MNSKLKSSILLVALLVSSCSIDSTTESSSPYSDYLQYSENLAKNLSSERIETRNNLINSLDSNNTFKMLLSEEKADINNLILIDAIAKGIKTISDQGFTIPSETHNNIAALDDGKGKIQFVVKAIGLTQEVQGGLTPELVSIFERYRKAFGYYGGPTTQYDANKNLIGEIKESYDLTPIFGVIDGKNPKVIDAITQAKIDGISSWSNEEDAIYSYLSDRKAYNQYLADNYPKSKHYIQYDIEISAKELYDAYQANEVAADERFKNKRVLVYGKISDIGKDILNDPYLSLGVGYLESVTCYFDKESNSHIASVSKGLKIEIIGTIKGSGMLGTGVILNKCSIWSINH